jgi:hypothetical protein
MSSSRKKLSQNAGAKSTPPVNGAPVNQPETEASKTVPPSPPPPPPPPAAPTLRRKKAADTASLPDLRKYRISQNYADVLKTRKKAVIVPLRKPDDQTWVYIHPEDGWRDSVAVLVDKANREIFVVEPELLPEITETFVSKLIVSYVTRAGSHGLWPIRLPDENGRLDTFNRSALEIVHRFSGQWIRVTLNAAMSCYEVWEMSTAVEMPEPKWPEAEGGFSYLFGLAFKANTISSLEHPLLKTLRGEL